MKITPLVLNLIMSDYNLIYIIPFFANPFRFICDIMDYIAKTSTMVCELVLNCNEIFQKFSPSPLKPFFLDPYYLQYSATESCHARKEKILVKLNEIKYHFFRTALLRALWIYRCLFSMLCKCIKYSWESPKTCVRRHFGG